MVNSQKSWLNKAEGKKLYISDVFDKKKYEELVTHVWIISKRALLLLSMGISTLWPQKLYAKERVPSISEINAKEKFIKETFYRNLWENNIKNLGSVQKEYLEKWLNLVLWSWEESKISFFKTMLLRIFNWKELESNIDKAINDLRKELPDYITSLKEKNRVLTLAILDIEQEMKEAEPEFRATLIKLWVKVSKNDSFDDLVIKFERALPEIERKMQKDKELGKALKELNKTLEKLKNLYKMKESKPNYA